MVARLGEVIYWASYGFAVLCLLALAVYPDGWQGYSIGAGGFLICGAVSYGFGRAALYVLAGR